MNPNWLVFKCKVHSVHISSIRHTMSKLFFTAGYVLCVSLAVSACNLEGNSNASTDIAAFQHVVELGLPIKSIRWEVFGTPEYSIGVPGPTDFVTLIAEVPSIDQATFEKKSKVGAVWIAPEAARPWVSAGSKSFKIKYRNASVDLSNFPDCRAAYGKSRKAGSEVHGFICNTPTKALIYLILADLSKS
jgi:hypothetical protein